MNSHTQPALLLASRVAAHFSVLPQVEAVVLAGSHTTQLAEAGSDIDLYVYWHSDIAPDTRKAIAETSATRVEVDNRFWEPGDEWIDAESGIHVDVMFRHTHWIEQQLARVLEHHEASVGYSTCCWHNVLTSKLLFDKKGWFAALQTRAQQPYPEILQQNIIAKNYPILRDNLSSYLYQIENAVRRDDKVSINHRITALLASYFDIIFALNRLPHPGEKRLVQIAETRCKILPDNMQNQIRHLLAAASTEASIINAVNTLIDGLDDLLKKQKLFRSKKNTVKPTTRRFI
jgi:hypothetical protein